MDSRAAFQSLRVQVYQHHEDFGFLQGKKSGDLGSDPLSRTLWLGGNLRGILGLCKESHLALTSGSVPKYHGQRERWVGSL